MIRATPANPTTRAPRAVIAGVGLLTPLGRDAATTWDALLVGHYVEDHARSAGESDRAHDQDATPRVIRMADTVARQAIDQAGWQDIHDVPVIVGTSKGSIESWSTPPKHIPYSPCVAGGQRPKIRSETRPHADRGHAGFFDDQNHPGPIGLGDIAAHLAQGYAPRLTLSGACASGMMALIRATMMIQSGHATRVLVVAAEASIHPLFIGSFKRLGVLPRPGLGCRPFDRQRDGFLMSEAAAAVCLEAHDAAAPVVHAHAAADPSEPGGGRMVAIDTFAMAGDAHHLTAADPDGRVLRHLINKVCDHRPVDLVHAHGTGTVTNDPVELAALESVLAAQTSTPCLYSHKGALGHSLGAAGLVSVVLNVLAHQRGVVPPNVRTTDPLPARHLDIAGSTVRRPVTRSIALAAGFGGATAAVSLCTL
jgi:3-oxoacyl-[acyl-carrier-protein] synthase II